MVEWLITMVLLVVAIPITFLVFALCLLAYEWVKDPFYRKAKRRQEERQRLIQLSRKPRRQRPLFDDYYTFDNNDYGDQ